MTVIKINATFLIGNFVQINTSPPQPTLGKSAFWFVALPHTQLTPERSGVLPVRSLFKSIYISLYFQWMLISQLKNYKEIQVEVNVNSSE